MTFQDKILSDKNSDLLKTITPVWIILTISYNMGPGVLAGVNLVCRAELDKSKSPGLLSVGISHYHAVHQLSKLIEMIFECLLGCF